MAAARYRNRIEAGRRLAAELRDYANRPDVVVLGLPRGGVPVAYEVARALGAPLDVFVVRKLGLPDHPEHAMGAIASGGVRVIDRDTVRRFGVTEAELAAVIATEERELDRRERRFRDGRPLTDVRGKTVILVDDGLATGATMSAAATALRAQNPAKLVVGVPVASPETCDAFRDIVDDIVCAVTPERFYAVGLWYEDFAQTTDEEVHDLLSAPPSQSGGGTSTDDQSGRQPVAESTVRVSAAGAVLEGTLAIPPNPQGVVLFAHGSGSSRHSPRNRFVAEQLRAGNLATLLIDLLSSDEEAIDERTRELRFDIGLLADRLVATIDWLGRHPETRGLDVGLFGASTGGGAALVAAAERPGAVAAVVSRGGRPDLARDALPRVRAPTLLIVGGKDLPVIELNRMAKDEMQAPVELEIIPEANHLFEEPGALGTVARLARRWFVDHLAPPDREREVVRAPDAREGKATGRPDQADAAR